MTPAIKTLVGAVALATLIAGTPASANPRDRTISKSHEMRTTSSRVAG
jgi:hypothetical protein